MNEVIDLEEEIKTARPNLKERWQTMGVLQWIGHEWFRLLVVLLWAASLFVVYHGIDNISNSLAQNANAVDSVSSSLNSVSSSVDSVSSSVDSVSSSLNSVSSGVDSVSSSLVGIDRTLLIK